MKPKILIVEDEPAIAETIQYALETDGFETYLLSAGMPVIPMLDQEAVDLIILDIGLPDISGLELCKEKVLTGTEDPLFQQMLAATLSDSSSAASSFEPGPVMSRPA